MNANEHTQYTVSQTHDGITGSRTFFTLAELFDELRSKLAANMCCKLSVDKYTPDEEELRQWAEMDKIEAGGKAV